MGERDELEGGGHDAGRVDREESRQRCVGVTLAGVRSLIDNLVCLLFRRSY